MLTQRPQRSSFAKGIFWFGGCCRKDIACFQVPASTAWRMKDRSCPGRHSRRRRNSPRSIQLVFTSSFPCANLPAKTRIIKSRPTSALRCLIHSLVLGTGEWCCVLDGARDRAVTSRLLRVASGAVTLWPVKCDPVDC